MKKLTVAIIALALLAMTTTPVLACIPEENGGSKTERLGSPSGYKGTWYTVYGKAVKQEDLIVLGPSPFVAKETSKVSASTRSTFFPNGNYTCFYNDEWDYYMCQPNNGNNMICKYFDNGNYACIFPKGDAQ